MLTQGDNELICRTGPGTAMGASMRHFWVPALLASELPESDGDPVHVELLGENFVAFRDSTGQVGLLDEMCCHRGASLTLGRVENCGIRCIYHGWLFAADGNILETPNVADPRFKRRFKAKSYPVREAGGFIWAYLGSDKALPAFPDFSWINAPASMRMATLQVNGCNYLQMIEGLLDSSHLTVLHSSALQAAAASDTHFAKATSHMKFDAAPRVESEETRFGLHYAAIRLLDGMEETRVCAFASPFWTFHPNGDIWIACVPMTDEKTAFYTVWWDGKQHYGEEPLKSGQRKQIGFDDDTLLSYGQTRSTFDSGRHMDRSNGFRQDRQLMARGHFSGVPALALEDSLVCVSAGPLRSREQETLSRADLAISHLFRFLLKSARQVRDGGRPIGAGVSFADIVGLNACVAPGTDWRSLVPQHRNSAPVAAVAAGGG
jgi:phthalate 4,5-dioxygenase oxygenase subunit